MDISYLFTSTQYSFVTPDSAEFLWRVRYCAVPSLFTLALLIRCSAKMCGSHLHANLIRSRISQAENDGVKAKVRTITQPQYCGRVALVYRLFIRKSEDYRRRLSLEISWIRICIHFYLRLYVDIRIFIQLIEI